MEKLLTRWGRELDKDMPLAEYPRPQFERESFICLNGRWEYAIYPKDVQFGGYQGGITVPFSPECILSGVERTVTPDDVLYYSKTFSFKRTNERVILNFGAVDYRCEVTLNGIAIGSHTGGYFPFSFDVTDEIADGLNTLKLSVTDPSETGTQARGKQTSERGNIWYTPQSGIWQTVWLEEVPADRIESVRLTPDIDNGVIKAEMTFTGERSDISLRVLDNGKEIAAVSTTGLSASIKLPSFEKWTPENPKLYDLEIVSGKDRIKSYFGMRKFGTGKDKNGVTRLLLNDKPYFHNGLLDQGYWSDGGYTAPDDEALIYDIVSMKEMGFNMLRKHIKIEPLRWYYHCDRLGMLVWQDMISGGGEYHLRATSVSPAIGLLTGKKKLGLLSDGPENYKVFSREDLRGREEYYTDSKRMLSLLYNSVSLCMWVPFNEGWGQFDAAKAAKLYHEIDSTRTIDHASGWHDQGAGDINSFHIYFTPFLFPKFDKNDNRAVALTEFGGYSMKTEGHVFNKDKFFGYRKYKDKSSLEEALRVLYVQKLLPRIKEGLSALVYTEVSDVEDELNGFLTYDRDVTKVTPEIMRDINDALFREFTDIENT